MKIAQLVTGGVMALAAVAFTAGSAHAIAFQNPSPKQVKTVESRIKASIKRTAVYKSTPGASIKLTYTPGTPSIGIDRSHVMPSISALITGQKQGMGMADNHERTYNLSVDGTKVSAKAAGKWSQLDTVVAPAAATVTPASVNPAAK